MRSGDRSDAGTRAIRWVAAISATALLAVAGCGGGGVDQAARDAAVAACRQAASTINDRTARRIADDACRAGATGDVRQASRDAKRAARAACLAQARKVVDPTARRQVEALCPSGR